MNGDAVRSREDVGVSVHRGRIIREVIDNMVGTYRVEHWRDGKLINTLKGKNLITNAGKNSMLGIMFHADTQLTAWYIGLVDNASFSTFAVGDTMSSHSGWLESVAYSDSTRQSWGVGAASGQSITNGSAAVFNINVNSTVIKGIFVTSISTKSGTTGTLWNGVAFSSNLSVNSGDQIKVTYTVSLS